MSQLARRTLTWTGLYLLFSLVPLLLMLIGPLPDGRGFWIELGVALGFLGLSMMAVQFALTARFPKIGGPFGLDTMMHFHRQAGIVAFLFVLAHPVIIILADNSYLVFFDPRENLPRAGALSMVTVLLVLVVALPICRQAISMPYEWWRLTHGLMASLVVIIGLGHVMMVGHYVDVWWKQGVWILVVGVALLLFGITRVFKPWQLRRKPYRVEQVAAETSRVWSVHLRADGHEGMDFDAGQFAWLNHRLTPMLFHEHPFTISSSAETPAHITLTIKELGDFTKTIGQTRPGETFYLDGPYGMFRLDCAFAASEIVLIAGGIGITPCLSMLRTMRDRHDTRPVMLVYANVTESSIAFRGELDEMAGQMRLQIHHVIENPEGEWNGYQGRLTARMLKEMLDGFTSRHTHYFICGPEPMMDVAERTLIEWGVHLEQRHAERFHIV